MLALFRILLLFILTANGFSVFGTSFDENKKLERCIAELTHRSYGVVNTQLSKDEVEEVRSQALALNELFLDKRRHLKKIRTIYYKAIEKSISFFKTVNGHKHPYYFYVGGEPQRFVLLRAEGAEERKIELQEVETNINKYLDYNRDQHLIYLNAILTLKYSQILKNLLISVKNRELNIGHGVTIFAPEHFNYGEVEYRLVSFKNEFEINEELNRLTENGVVTSQNKKQKFHPKFVDYVVSNWLRGRDLEQAYIFRLLPIYQKELRRALALKDKDLRKTLEDKIKLLLSEQAGHLLAPMSAMNNQLERELALEVSYYHGERSDSDVMEDANLELSIGQRFELGIDGDKITLGRRFFRMSLLSTPLILASLATAKIVPYMYDQAEDLLFESHKREVIYVVDDEVHLKKLKDYLEDHGIELRVPFEQWDPKDKELYIEIKTKRKAYLEQMENEKATLETKDKAVEERLYRLEKYINMVFHPGLDMENSDKELALFGAEKIISDHGENHLIEEGDKELFIKMYQRTVELKALGYSDIDIKMTLLKEFF